MLEMTSRRQSSYSDKSLPSWNLKQFATNPCGCILNGLVVLGHPYMLYLLQRRGAASNPLLNPPETEESSAGQMLPKIKQSTEGRRKQTTTERDGCWPGLMIKFLGNCECLEKISAFPDVLMILMTPKCSSGEAV